MRGRSPVCHQLFSMDPLAFCFVFGPWSEDSSGCENKQETKVRQGVEVSSPHYNLFYYYRLSIISTEDTDSLRGERQTKKTRGYFWSFLYIDDFYFFFVLDVFSLRVITLSILMTSRSKASAFLKSVTVFACKPFAISICVSSSAVEPNA